MTTNHIPLFDSYVCVGDSITWKKDGYTITAKIENDDFTHPENFDCYTAQDVQDWKDDKWEFIGLVFSVSKNGVTLDDEAACMFGIDCDFSAESSAHLNTICIDMESEVLEQAKKKQKEIMQALNS